jgi:hypothetical protein
MVMGDPRGLLGTSELHEATLCECGTLAEWSQNTRDPGRHS